MIADVLRDLVLETPPNVTAGSWIDAMPDLLRSARLGKRVAKLDMPMRRELLALFVKSAGDYLDGWFESDPIKAAYGFDGIVGNYASPYAGGSAYVLLHHVFGRGQRQEGGVGPRDRRHGRDLTGHGQISHGAWGSTSARRPECVKSSSSADGRWGS